MPITINSIIKISNISQDRFSKKEHQVIMLYLPYYSLKEEPFQDTANPKFFWFGEEQSEAIAILKFGIDKGEGITLLTGDIGVGKTILAKYLAGLLDDTYKIVKVDDSDLDTKDFLLFLADSFKLPTNFDDKKSFFRYIDEEYSKTQKRMLIILDEAHRATRSLLNDIDLMAKIKRDNEKLINIILVGQTPLIELVKEIKANGNGHRHSIVCHLRPLTKTETNKYIKHRLKIAGTERNLFSSGAIGKIFQISGGIPRVINTICDHAMMIGYSTDSKKIKTSVIKECAEDLQIRNRVFGNGKDPAGKTSGEKIVKQAYNRTKQKLFTWTS
ncbi:MAG: AAA family ATPase [Desulfobacterales bacterium]